MNRHWNKPHFPTSIETIKLLIALTMLFTCLLLSSIAQGSTNIDFSDEEKEHLAAKGRVTMCVDPDWMPYERIDEQGKHVGIAADFMSEFQKRIPVPIELVLTESWKESLEAAKSRQCDILSLLNESPQRREFLNFTDPYLTDSVVIVARNDVFYLDGLESLSGRKLGIVEGYVYEEKIRKQYPEIIIISVKSAGDALRKVSDGKIYATLDALFIITSNIQELGLSNLKIAGQTGLDNAFRVGVRKDDPILLSVFNKMIKNLDDATRNGILRSWYTIKFQYGTDWTIVWQVTGIALIILCLLGYHNLLTRRFNRKLAEANKLLRASEERLSLLIDQSPMGIISWDINFRVVSWNNASKTIFGYSAEEALGQYAEFIIPKEARKHVEQVWQGLLAMDGGTRSTNENVTRSGQAILCDWYNATLVDSADKVIGVMSLVENVTERGRTEKELLKVKKLESIGILAGGIAHDFNNILAAILGNINLALIDQDLKDKTKKLLSEAERASLRAKDLTQQLLTFARGGDPVKEASSLESVIKDSANFVLHGDKVACRYDIPEGLWLVDIDKGQMSQVIQNIVLNASHAMPEGGIVAITCENVISGDYSDFPLLPKGRFVKICIQDKGVGIPANVVDNIFDPYFSTKHGGSGLGLAITNSIINKHKGYISVESSPGVGATFTLYLPASEQEKATSQKSEVYRKASSQAKILLMDDEQMVRAVAKEMLMELGHGVELSENGKEAIKLYMEAINTNNKFDIVIMDLTIPGGMDGKEAVQKILNLDPDAKVIVSSGYSNDPVMANFKDYGFCSAIVKPYQLQELSKVINQLID